MATRTPRVLSIDAGGTMTDTVVVDRDGRFVVGKAQTTPQDEAVGFMASARDALAYWELTPEQAFPEIVSGVYSGTTMLNRLVERKGRRVGCIVSGGLEDYLRLERGVQTHLGLSRADKLHVATHHHNPPLVPRERMRGVRGRIDVFGEEAVPLYEADVRAAVAALLDERVESIVVSLLNSYRNPSHERRVKEIVEEAKDERRLNGHCPVFLSSELYPQRRDFPRLNSTVIEAYAAEPARTQLRKVREVTRACRAGFALRIMAAHGGMIDIEARELGRTLISGPIGGVIGARHLARRLDLPNVLCTDIGGTSFDVALITDGEIAIRQTPAVGRFVLNLPLVQVDAIGAGTGSFVRLNPNSNRPELGPDSAGSRIGVCWREGGVETPTISDLNLILGRLNPQYFLGGDVALDVEYARHVVSERLAEPLGVSTEAAAAGIVELFEETLSYAAVSQILGKGYAPSDYALVCYGGGGPSHVAGYAAGVPYRDVLVPAWAAGFSAYGCACADFEYRYDLTVDLEVGPGVGAALERAWQQLRARVASEFAKSGIGEREIDFRHSVRMMYQGQLNDLEVPGDDVDRLVERFEAAYGKLYARSARSPELGYLITTAIVTGAAAVEKPQLPDEPLTDGTPPVKELRPVWFEDGFVATPIHEQRDVRAGQVVAGPAIIEAPSDTFVIPPGCAARLDRHRIFHLEQA